MPRLPRTLRRAVSYLALAGAVGAAVARPAAAQPRTVTFETLGLPDNSRIVGEYEGLIWDNLWVLKGNDPLRAGTGYQTAASATSSTWVVFNGAGTDAELSSAVQFGLESAVFAAAWENGLGLTVTGYDAANGVVGTVVTTLDVLSAKVIPLNLFGVRRVTFRTTRGTPVNPDLPGKQFALDNLVVRVGQAYIAPSTTVPEPGSLALLAVGAAGVGLIARARRRRH